MNKAVIQLASSSTIIVSERQTTNHHHISPSHDKHSGQNCWLMQCYISAQLRPCDRSTYKTAWLVVKFYVIWISILFRTTHSLGGRGQNPDNHQWRSLSSSSLFIDLLYNSLLTRQSVLIGWMLADIFIAELLCKQRQNIASLKVWAGQVLQSDNDAGSEW